jgi:hypothetical protein
MAARTNSETLAAVDTTAATAAMAEAPVIIDLGKHKRKQVKKLRRGEGKLLDDVRGAVAELRTAGTLKADAQPVIIVVREKKRNRLKSLFPL